MGPDHPKTGASTHTRRYACLSTWHNAGVAPTRVAVLLRSPRSACRGRTRWRSNASPKLSAQPRSRANRAIQLHRAFATNSRRSPDRGGRSRTGKRSPKPAFSLVRGSSEHVVAGEGFEPSKLSRWIYSPLPLAARATCLGAGGTIATQLRCASNRGRHPTTNHTASIGNTPTDTSPLASLGDPPQKPKEPTWPMHRSTS